MRPEEGITIKRYLNGELCFWYNDKKLSYTKLASKPEAPSKSKKYYRPKGIDSQLCRKNARKNKKKTPWSQFNTGWLKGKRTA